MTSSSPLSTLLSHYEHEARAALVVEEELRREFMRVVTDQERVRAYAFRRAHLLRAMSGAALGAENGQQAVEAQIAAAWAELGWQGKAVPYEGVLEHLANFAKAVWTVAQSGDSALPAAQSALREFEAWFEERHGRSFYSVFEQRA